MGRPTVSVVIPTKGRTSLLLWNLQELKRQSLRSDMFEVVVVSDGDDLSDEVQKKLDQDRYPYSLSVYIKDQKGPASARNFGVAKSVGDIILFVGDDCVPDRNLLWRHFYARHRLEYKLCAVQGYTLWHPEIPPDDFMNFLVEESGIQANWRSLKTDDGKWKDQATSWFMTTNCSINKSVFESEGGFSEDFPNAAWEDVELGFRFAQHGLITLFSPDAINYHYHRITLDSYIKRQIMEGESRLVFCSLHPEIAGSLLDPNGLRKTSPEIFQEAIRLAKETHYITSQDLQDTRKVRWANALRYSSLEGIRRGIEKRGGIWKAIPHVHTEELARNVAGAASGLERGNPLFAKMEAEWALKLQTDNWALYCVLGEVELALGQKNEALLSFTKALELGPTEKWPMNRVKELRGE